MIDLKDINANLENDLLRFNEALKEAAQSNVELINIVINYMLKNKGKQLRPILCLLSSRLISEPNKSTITAASLIEMIHVATLVHDDIVDNADIRRGWPSVKSVWKNKASLLVGDYLFSKALSNMIKLRSFDALEVLSETASRLSEGELLQMQYSKIKSMDESIYLKMVSDKTASLFSAASKIGAITVEATGEQQEALRSFGEKLGIAFQIKDDLFDVMGSQSSVGKPVGFDVKKNIMTLPFIHFMSNLNSSDRSKYKSKLKFHSKNKNIVEIRRMINDSGSIAYTEDFMSKISSDAISDLDIFEDSDAKKSLILLVEYNLERVK